jgi:hypothetical protein
VQRKSVRLREAQLEWVVYRDVLYSWSGWCTGMYCTAGVGDVQGGTDKVKELREVQLEWITYSEVQLQWARLKEVELEWGSRKRCR